MTELEPAEESDHTHKNNNNDSCMGGRKMRADISRSGNRCVCLFITPIAIRVGAYRAVRITATGLEPGVIFRYKAILFPNVWGAHNSIESKLRDRKILSGLNGSSAKWKKSKRGTIRTRSVAWPEQVAPYDRGQGLHCTASCLIFISLKYEHEANNLFCSLVII